MRKDIKKISLAVLALSAVSLAGVAVGGLSVREASAGTTLNTLESFRVENVSVRLAVSDEETNGGFRFETLIGTEAYEGLTNVTEVGTLFVPAGFNVADASIALDENGAVLNEKVQKVVLEGGTENRRGGLVTTDENGADVISYRAYINDIPDTAYGAVVTARSYVIADGVAYYTETVNESVGSVATKAYYDVQSEADEVYCNEVADGWYSPFVEAQRNEIGAYVKTTAKTYEKQYVVVANGNATLDLTAISVNADDVVGVTVDGAFTEWSVDGSTLTYATTVGEKTLAVATTKGVYNVALVQADNVITTGAEFTQWIHKDKGNFAGGKYTVLANDITPTGTHYMNTFPTDYVFNGLGHTIDGFSSGMGLVLGLNGGNTAWKNVNYTNYKGGMLLYNAIGGTFENVNVTGTVSDKDNLLAYTINRSNTIVRNCVFNVNHTTAGTTLKVASKGSANTIIFENSTVIYGNGNLTYPDTVTLEMTNSNIYDIDDVNTNYYAKVSGGTATFPLSQMGTDAPTTISKLLVNGAEVKATVTDGNLTYPATKTGVTSLMVTSDKGFRVMNIAHADNVITTFEQFSAWGSTDDHNKYEYTVLANDITDTNTAVTAMKDFYKTFDGLGHTIKDFKPHTGITREMQAGATWKNVNYTNLQSNDWGVLGRYLKGGTFENVHIEGVSIKWDKGLLAYGIAGSVLISNCSIKITSDTKADKRFLINGEAWYYTCTMVNTTIEYCNDIELSVTSDGKTPKTVITNCMINGVKVG